MVARFLREMLLLSCVLAFVTGVVIAGARLLGVAGAGASAPERRLAATLQPCYSFNLRKFGATQRAAESDRWPPSRRCSVERA